MALRAFGTEIAGCISSEERGGGGGGMDKEGELIADSVHACIYLYLCARIEIPIRGTRVFRCRIPADEVIGITGRDTP